MTNMRSTLFPTLILIYLFGPANALCTPVPQGNPQAPATANHPPQAQVLLAPAPIQTGALLLQAPLPADARKPDQVLHVGHTQRIQALAFSPDGKWLASGGNDTSIIVWNLSLGREEFHLGGLPVPLAAAKPSGSMHAVSALLFNPDGTRLVSVEVSGAVKVWNLQTHKILFTIHPPRVHYYGGSIAYSADGKSLLIPLEKRAANASEMAAICFYDADTGKITRSIPTKWDDVSAIVPTKDGRLLAAGTVGGYDDDDPPGSVQLFDLASGEAQKTYPIVVSAISADGRWMSSFDNTGIYHPVLWDLNDGKRIHDLTPKNASRIIFRPDGQELAVTHGDSEAIDFVSTSSGEITKSLPGGGYGLGTAAYSADGKFLAAGSYAYGTIKVWDLASMKEKLTLYGQSPVQSVAFSPNGKLLAATSGELRVWDVANGTEVATVTDGPVNRAVFSADGKWLAANPGGQFAGYAVKIWDTTTWKELASVPKEKGFPASWLALNEAKSAPQKIGNVQSLHVVAGEESHTLWGSFQAMAISPDGKLVAEPGGMLIGNLEIWDATTGQKLQSIPAHRLTITNLLWSPDGRRLISVGEESNPMMVQGQADRMIAPFTFAVWDTWTWKKEFAFTFLVEGGPGADISADGKIFAFTKGGGATQLFDLEQKKPIAVLASPNAWPGNLAISPDGTVVVQGAGEGVRLWRLPPIKEGSN
ncbi:MAG TPA: WD40 repeat domain-containing protein [Candidatus Acidoferrum sp.]|nr:WD40 repeat domain-containing protein [Candidatus Acidoferrum sp.]